MTLDQLWQAALGQLELRVSQGNFLTWFRDTHITNQAGPTITVETPSAFAHEWLSRKYHLAIQEVLHGLDHTVEQVNFTIRAQIKGHRPIKRTTHIIMHKHRRPAVLTGIAPTLAALTDQPLPPPTTTLNRKYTFDSFIIGTNNEVAHAACKAVSSKLGTAYNPLFLYGGVGLGKTHLMHAIGNAVIEIQPTTHVLYATSEKFINEFVQALRDHDTQSFKNRYRSVDLLMIDDVQFMAGKAKCQEELFHTFNALYSQNKQIILSSDRSPKSIPTFEERLRSRLTGGMLVDIQQPDYETRLAILQDKAAQSTATIMPEALEYIAKNVQKNVRELEGALNRVLGYCELHKQVGTLQYAKKMLEGIIDRPITRLVDAKKIIETVSLYYNISFDELCGKRRQQEIVRPRQVAMYLLRHENNISFPSIGQQFGGRDHTTAMHACEKIMKLLEHDDELAQDITFIKERLYA